MLKKIIFTGTFIFIFFVNAEDGCLEVESEPPGADVEINGNIVGKTPLRNYCVKEGKYVVNVKSPCHENNYGHNINRVVNVKKGKTCTLNIRLVPIYQRASFNVVDEDGKELEDVTLITETGDIAKIPGRVNLPVCKTDLVFAKDGYKDIKFTLDLSKPATISLKMIRNDKPSPTLMAMKDKTESSKVLVKEGDKIVIHKKIIPPEEMVKYEKKEKKEQKERKKTSPVTEKFEKDFPETALPVSSFKRFDELFPFFKIGFPIAFTGLAVMAVGMHYNTEYIKAYYRYQELVDPVYIEKLKNRDTAFDVDYHHYKAGKVKDKGDDYKKNRNILYITGGALIGAGLIFAFIPSIKKGKGQVSFLPVIIGENNGYGFSLNVTY